MFTCYLFDEPPSWIILHGALLALFSKFQDLILQAEFFFSGQPSWSRQLARSPLPRGRCSWRVARLISHGAGGAGSPHIWCCIAHCKPWAYGDRWGVSTILWWQPRKNVIQCLHVSTIPGKSVVEVSVREIIVSKFIFVVLLWDQLCDFEQYSLKLPSSCQWTWRKGSESNKYSEDPLRWRASPHAGARWAGCWCPRRWWRGQCPRSRGSTSPPHTPPALGTCGQPGTVTDVNISWLSNISRFFDRKWRKLQSYNSFTEMTEITRWHTLMERRFHMSQFWLNLRPKYDWLIPQSSNATGGLCHSFQIKAFNIVL